MTINQPLLRFTVNFQHEAMKTNKYTAILFAIAASVSMTEANTYYMDAEGFEPKVQDSLNFAKPGEVSLKGTINSQIQRSLNGDILTWDIDSLVRPFALKMETDRWQTEFWGKWYTSAQLAYAYEPSGKLADRLDYARDELLRTALPNGEITTYKPQYRLKAWDLWGRKYVMLGLIADYERTGDKSTLQAARKEAQSIMSGIGPEDGKLDINKIDWWGGLASGSALEPFALLYRQTADPKVLGFAEYIASSYERDNGPKIISKALAKIPVVEMFRKPADKKDSQFGNDGRSKAYEMMSCYEGLAELYRITGNKRYFDAVEAVAENIYENEITVLGSGSACEKWVGGKTQQYRDYAEWMETCVTTTWIKLCSQMLRLTGESKYADRIERAAYNALIAAHRKDGAWWAHFSKMNGIRVPAPEHCSMHMNCCVANGPRSLMLLPKMFFMTHKNGLRINFYEKAKAELSFNGGEVRLSIGDMDYINSDTVKISIDKVSGISEAFEIGFRIPQWSEDTYVSINGEPAQKVPAGDYYRLTRKWKAGDEVSIKFDLRPRIETDPVSGRYAILKGPYVYAMDKRFEKNFDKPAKIAIGADGRPIASVEKADDLMGALDVKLADGSVRRFVPYPDAGQTWDENSEFRVWFENK